MNSKLDELGVSANRIERGAELVTHLRKEIRFCLVGFLRTLPRLLRLRPRLALSLEKRNTLAYVRNRSYKSYGPGCALDGVEDDTPRCMYPSQNAIVTESSVLDVV